MEKKRKVGRPKKTAAEVLPKNWKERMLELYSYGYHETEIKKDLGINVRQWENLKEDNEDFRKTLNQGSELAKAFYWNIARSNFNNKDFRMALFQFIMFNRWGYQHAAVRLEHTGRIEHDVRHKVKEYSKSTPEELLDELNQAIENSK